MQLCTPVYSWLYQCWSTSLLVYLWVGSSFFSGGGGCTDRAYLDLCCCFEDVPILLIRCANKYFPLVPGVPFHFVLYQNWFAPLLRRAALTQLGLAGVSVSLHCSVDVLERGRCRTHTRTDRGGCCTLGTGAGAGSVPSQNRLRPAAVYSPPDTPPPRLWS